MSSTSLETLLASDLLQAEVAEEIVKPRSVVKSAYKAKYAARAIEKGRKSKAAQRSCQDWLALTLAKLVLDEDEKLVVELFEAVLDQNGVPHAHWNRTTKGWQGRLRMTGRLALQSVVADVGYLVGPDGEQHAAPTSWCVRTQR